MLSTPAMIAFFVFLGLLGLGIFLTGSILHIARDLDIAQVITARWNSLTNLLGMLGLFTVVVYALWAISNHWGTTVYDRRLYAFSFIFFGLGFLAPLFAQISLWARCKAIASAPVALRVAR